MSCYIRKFPGEIRSQGWQGGLIATTGTRGEFFWVGWMGGCPGEGRFVGGWSGCSNLVGRCHREELWGIGSDPLAVRHEKLQGIPKWGGFPSQSLPMGSGFWFLVCYAATQLATPLHQRRIQVVRSNMVTRKRLSNLWLRLLWRSESVSKPLSLPGIVASTTLHMMIFASEL